MASDANDAKAQNATNEEAEHREAMEYWGYLIKEDKCGTEVFDRLLRGIAEVISRTFEPCESPDLTPTQIAAFYRAVGGNYDVLFVDTPPSSISFIYKSLGAFHSLQPGARDDGYEYPTIPALKTKGFVKWQTIQVLLGPEEHVPFLQRAVAQFDVVDPETGDLFPKVLPKECLPSKPDDAMEQWYEKVAERLKREAEEDSIEKDSGFRGPRVVVDDGDPQTWSDMSDRPIIEGRYGAAKYFSDPLNRKSGHWASSNRHFSSRYDEEKNRGRLISSVRHMLRPFSRRSLPGKYTDDDSYSDEDETPIAAAPPSPPPPPRYASHKRPHPPRRESTLSTTDSDSDSNRPPSRRRTPVLRNRLSHEPMGASPREYYAESYNSRRYSHEVPVSGREGLPPSYGPTKAPLFATHVAHMQANNYYDRRAATSPRTSRRTHGVRYSAPPPDVDLSYPRERERDRDRDGDRDRDAYEPLGGSGRHRRRSDELLRERERSGRMTRSHERVRDEWDARESRSTERDRDGERRTHRYVAAVQDGVGGRRYPVEQPWR